MTSRTTTHQPRLDDPDPAEVDALADVIEEVRTRPGITSADTLAWEILQAGWYRTPEATR